MSCTYACRIGLVMILSMAVVTTSAYAGGESHHDEWFFEGGVGASRVSDKKESQGDPAQAKEVSKPASGESVAKQPHGKDDSCTCGATDHAHGSAKACPHHEHQTK